MILVNVVVLIVKNTLEITLNYFVDTVASQNSGNYVDRDGREFSDFQDYCSFL